MKFTNPATLLKVRLLYESFSHFLNCTNGTKSCDAPHLSRYSFHVIPNIHSFVAICNTVKFESESKSVLLFHFADWKSLSFTIKFGYIDLVKKITSISFTLQSPIANVYFWVSELQCDFL